MQLGREVQSPAQREEPLHESLEAGDQTAGKQLSKNGSGGHQAVHEPGMCSCSREGTFYPGLHQADCFQQIKGDDPSSVLNLGQSKLEHRVQCWAPQEGHTGESPWKGHKEMIK